MDVIKIRASSLGELFDCPARWGAKYINGWRLPTSGAAQLGTAVHAGAAAFDMGSGTIDDCTDAVVETLHEAKDIAWGDLDIAEAEKIAISLHKLYCQQIAPQFHFVGIEVGLDSVDFPDLGIGLTGTADRVYMDEEGRIGIADIKTGKSVVSADGSVKAAAHKAQLGAYELLVWQAVGKPITAPAKIIGLQTAKTKQGQRTGIGQVEGAMNLLLGSPEDESEPCLLQTASEIIKSGRFYGNPKSGLCSSKYCPAYGVCKYK